MCIRLFLVKTLNFKLKSINLFDNQYECQTIIEASGRIL